MVFELIKQKLNKLKNNKAFLKYFKNTSWLFFSKGLSFFSTIYIGAWIASYLGPEEYGVLMYSNSIIMLFMPIALIGLTDITIKALVEETDTQKHQLILATSFFLKLIFGSIAFIFLLFFLLLTEDSMYTKLLLLVFSSYLLIQSFEVFDYFFQSNIKSRFVVYSRIFSLILTSIIKILLIIYEASSIYFAISIVLELLLTHLFTVVYFFSKNKNLFKWKLDMNIAKDFINRSWPLFLSGLMFVIYIRIDQVMVKEILGAKSAGLYAASINLSEAWYFIPNIIAASLFPAILISKKQSLEVYLKRIKNLYSILFWIAVLIAILTTFLSDIIVNYLYGIDYDESSSVLIIYIWSNIFFFLNAVSSKWLVAEGFYLHSLYRNALGALLNIVLNYFLLYKYGLQGAAIATLISYSFVGLFYDLFFKKLRVNFKLKIKSIFYIN
tara:strand:- start:5339 stop:6658 length:1320 start_codon:yes stop_codon:yes gene_type:complete